MNYVEANASIFTPEWVASLAAKNEADAINENWRDLARGATDMYLKVSSLYRESLAELKSARQTIAFLQAALEIAQAKGNGGAKVSRPSVSEVLSAALSRSTLPDAYGR